MHGCGHDMLISLVFSGLVISASSPAAAVSLTMLIQDTPAFTLSPMSTFLLALVEPILDNVSLKSTPTIHLYGDRSWRLPSVGKFF